MFDLEHNLHDISFYRMWYEGLKSLTYLCNLTNDWHWVIRELWTKQIQLKVLFCPLSQIIGKTCLMFNRLILLYFCMVVFLIPRQGLMVDCNETAMRRMSFMGYKMFSFPLFIYWEYVLVLSNPWEASLWPQFSFSLFSAEKNHNILSLSPLYLQNSLVLYKYWCVPCMQCLCTSASDVCSAYRSQKTTLDSLELEL